jgi:hypothetical protein
MVVGGKPVVADALMVTDNGMQDAPAEQ